MEDEGGRAAAASPAARLRDHPSRGMHRVSSYPSRLEGWRGGPPDAGPPSPPRRSSINIASLTRENRGADGRTHAPTHAPTDARTLSVALPLPPKGVAAVLLGAPPPLYVRSDGAKSVADSLEDGVGTLRAWNAGRASPPAPPEFTFDARRAPRGEGVSRGAFEERGSPSRGPSGGAPVRGQTCTAGAAPRDGAAPSPFLANESDAPPSASLVGRGRIGGGRGGIVARTTLAPSAAQ